MTDRRRAITLVAFASIVQLAIAAATPLDPDETYYWDWSRHVATGYFDHPPMVAFFIKLGVTLFGATPLGVRFVSILANCVATLLLVEIARRHAGERAAWRAACIASALPILTGWLLLATPDPACYLFATLALFAVDSALTQPARSTTAFKWWALAGLCSGLAMTSKYVAVLMPASIVVGLLSHRRLWHRFAEPGPYVACLVAALAFAPVVLWNAQHDWVSFRFQLHHGLGAGGGSSTDRVLGYVGGQAAFVTPILFVMMVLAIARAMRKSGDVRRHLLAVIAAFSFLWFLASSIRQPVEANWPLLAYPAAVVVLATASATQQWDRWLTAGIGLGAAFVLVIYLQMLVRIIPFPPDNDPVRRGHGWDEVAARVAAAARVSTGGRTWIAANSYQSASELAFQIPDHPEVLSLNYESRPNQYDLWPSFEDRAARCDNLVLLIDDAAENSARAVGTHFKEVHQGDLVVPGGSAPLLSPKRIWTFTCWDRNRLND